MKTFLLTALVSIGLALKAGAVITAFDLRGTGGFGLLNTNEPGPPTGGTGGEIGAGIFFDSTSSQLTVNVGWGSGNGFTDMTGTITAQHIHGPTASVNGSGFTQTAAVLFPLTATSTSASNGSIQNNVINLTAAQVTDLFNGKYYVNVHTAVNGGGEARGFLVVAVPEPSRAAFAMLGLSMLALRRRR